VSGLMMANHTSIQRLFQKTMRQYDDMRKRNAFVANYRKEKMFSDGLEEFDSSKEVVASLIDEYAASERADYLTWGMEDEDRKTVTVAGAGTGMGSQMSSKLPLDGDMEKSGSARGLSRDSRDPRDRERVPDDRKLDG